MQINWPLVGMVLKTGVAEGKEIDMQGLLLAMRVIPVTNRPDTAAAIILQDITELKKKRYRAAYQICSYLGNTSSR